MKPSRWQVVVAAVVLVVLASVAIGVLVAAITGDVPKVSNPNFIDVVFASRAVVAAARIALLAIGTYVVVSVVARIGKGQWLSSVGPFKVGESVQTVSDEAENLRDELEAAENTIGELSRRLEAAMAAVNVAKRDRDEVIREFGKQEKAFKAFREQAKT